jgi:chorismate mutase / prephenate dehydratase
VDAVAAGGGAAARAEAAADGGGPAADAAQPAPAATAPEARAKKPAQGRSKHYRLADRAARAEDTIVRVGDLLIGGSGFIVMAGPCAVESQAQIQSTALHVRERGAHILRGGVFKPRTSPYSFQGLGLEGLDLLAAAGRACGMPIVTEVMSPEQVRPVAEKADILPIGARNMQNFQLLREVGKVDRPVLLKRGLSSTIEEWLAAAEYILAQGNGQVILCERGIRTFESATRNTLDLSAVVVLRERTHLPVVVDPSHGTGRSAVPVQGALGPDRAQRLRGCRSGGGASRADHSFEVLSDEGAGPLSHHGALSRRKRRRAARAGRRGAS